MKILVVDDEEYNLDILEKYLDKAGYESILANSGEEAWDILQENADNISVILLDRMMPGIDGLELISKIKPEPAINDIPIIMQSAATEKNQIIEGIEAGVYYYLTKPFEEEMLISIVKAAINDNEKQQALKHALKQQKQTLALTESSSFAFKTLEEARNLAVLVANFFPDPERVVYGISELFINAIEHGNLKIGYDEKTTLCREDRWEDEINRRLELDEHKSKSVHVQYQKEDDSMHLTIKDEGDGFAFQNYLEISSDRATDNHGRGIAMSRILSFDDLEYLGNGNEVRCSVKHA